MRLAGWAPADLLDHEPLEVERDRHEGHRLAYVAATRARDLLVVPVVGDAPFTDGWVSPLNEAIYPSFNRRHDPETGTAWPSFKRDSVLERPNGDPARAETVQPGLHRFNDGTDEPYSVVWWDPAVLALDQRPPMGVRHENLIGKGASRAVVEETLAAYRTWETGRASAIAAASHPSLVVTTASEWAAGERELPDGASLPDIAVHVVGDRLEDGRPSGTRFGALVHAVLAGVALDADVAAVETAARTQARLLGATADDEMAAVDAARRVLASPWIRRAAASKVCRRELPLTLSDGDNGIIEGVADLVFDEAAAWVVVEFKTDVEIGRLGLDRYRRQVGLYVAAIARATGRSASGVLLRI